MQGLKTFGFSLDLHYLWLRRKHLRSRKLKILLVFFSLIRTFADKFKE